MQENYVFGHWSVVYLYNFFWHNLYVLFLTHSFYVRIKTTSKVGDTEFRIEGRFTDICLLVGKDDENIYTNAC